MTMRLPRPRHGDPLQTTQQLRELAASVLSEDVQTLARTTSYLRRSYRVVFVAYIAMMVFGVSAIVAAFVKGMTADNMGAAAAAIGLAGAHRRHLHRLLRPAAVGGAGAERDLHAVGVD